MIRYLQLPFYFDAARLQNEVSNLTDSWALHFNRQCYEGAWSGVSLRAPGGRTDNLLTESCGRDEAFEDTPLMNECPAIKQVLQTIQCPHTSVRLLKLDRGAVIREHSDAGLNFEHGEVRLHIPVVTHPQVEFYLDGDRLVMEPGSCWYINASLPHWLSNPSPVHRTHLVVDCMVNDWLTGWFSRTDLPVKQVRDTTQEDLQRRNEVIQTLRKSNDPARIRLADELERQIQPASS